MPKPIVRHSALTAVLAVLVVLLACAGDAVATPTYLLKDYSKIGQDRSFKVDLAADLSKPPQLVVFGGSRAMRFGPSDAYDITGLTALNAAVQNCRPEDMWAIASFLFRRAPRVDLRCVMAVQATTFSDKEMHQGLLYDRRLSRWFPDSLVARQKALVGTPRASNLLAKRKYSSRGLLLWNGYDARFAAGVTLDEVIAGVLPRMLETAGDTTPVRQVRSKLYFEKTLKLFNDHGVTPVIVIMPYHPTALAAMREVGWEVKVDRLREYLASIAGTYEFEVLDLLEIATFGGSPDEFYDTSHVTRENSRRILQYADTVVPQCFDPLTPSPSPSPSETATVAPQP